MKDHCKYIGGKIKVKKDMVSDHINVAIKASEKDDIYLEKTLKQMKESMKSLEESNIEVTYNKDKNRVIIDTGLGYVTLELNDIQSVVQKLKDIQYYASRTPIKDVKYYGKL